MTAILAASALVPPLSAQSIEALSPGDVVRVDHEFVGTLMSIDEERHLVVMGEGKPTCWPGIMHGEGPRCDPAPIVRRVVDWGDATIERQLVEASYAKRTIIGFLIGSVAFAPIGYLTGPSLGYGKIDACVEITVTELCSVSISREEAEARQRSQDQRRGALFFSALGGSIGAIVARKTANEWIEIEPPFANGDDGWSVGVRLPTGGR